MMTDDDRFDELIRDAARELDPPPPPPREAMWAHIQQARHAGRSRHGPRWVATVARWTLPLAAALVLGVGIGRFTARDTPGPAFVELAPPSDSADFGPALPYRVAAVQHLERTEALLTSLPSDARSDDASEAAGWARDLLANTRLLIDSPASDDPQLGRLLQDLELILAQIAALEGRAPAGELELIEDGIQRNDMLTRLRAATTVRPFAGT